jgi:hypothetical protein
MFEDDDSHIEERGPPDAAIQFSLRVLEDDTKDGRRYLHVLAETIDASRSSGTPGSSSTPLCSSFLLYENGDADMPHAQDIYDDAFPASNTSLERTRDE